nr:MAG TPA: hypothetical protein [Caudoviricetes sp.]
MRNEKTLLGSTGLNIQLFAGEGGYEYGNVNLSAGEQAKYANSVKRALNTTKKMPLEGWFEKSASTNEAYSLFYVSGRLESRDIDDKQAISGPNYTPAEVKGQDTGTFLRSIKVIPTGMECPVYVKRRDFNRSQLDEKSTIIDAQVAATYGRCAIRVAELFKDCITNKKRTVTGSDNKTFDLVIPDSQFFGDKTKEFDTPENIKLFRKMMLQAQEAASNQGLRIAIVSGIEGNTELANAERFSSKDFGEGETRKTGQPLSMLMGGHVERLFQFDKTLYPLGSEEVGYFLVMVERSFGQDNKDVSVTPEANYIADKKAYLLDVEVYNSTELLNPEGVFIFEYKRTTGAAAASIETEKMSVMSLANNEQLEQEKEIEKMRMERVEKELELERLRAANKQAAVTETQEAPATTTTTTKAAKKSE